MTKPQRTPEKEAEVLRLLELELWGKSNPLPGFLSNTLAKIRAEVYKPEPLIIQGFAYPNEARSGRAFYVFNERTEETPLCEGMKKVRVEFFETDT